MERQDQTGGLDIEVIDGEEGTLVRLTGRLSIDSAPSLRNRLLVMLQSERQEAVTVDLSNTPYIDCSGIATLIEALKIAHRNRTTLRLQGLRDRLLHLLQVTGVLALFDEGGPAATSSVKTGV